MDIGILTEKIDLLNENLGPRKEVTPENVLQVGNRKNREIVSRLMDTLLKPGSGIKNPENIKKLYEYCKSGKSCLLLVEHYSNFDYPAVFKLIDETPDLGPEISESLLPIQGLKLSEGEGLTATFSRSYSTIIIYPSRSIDSAKDEKEKEKIKKISGPINHAAIKTLTKEKYNGKLILVFPAGTRYRPWKPETKKGVREIFSYLKTFDYVSFVSINGNILRPSETEDMEMDIPKRDVILLTFSKPYEAKKIQKQWQKETPEGENPRQYVVDRVMDKLFTMHDENKPEYEKRVKGREI